MARLIKQTTAQLLGCTSFVWRQEMLLRSCKGFWTAQLSFEKLEILGSAF